MAKKPVKKPLPAKKAAKKAVKKAPAKKAAKKAVKKVAKKPNQKVGKNLGVYILLDRSGSMQTKWDESLSALNSYVNNLDKQSRVVLATFDSEGYDIIRDGSAGDWKAVTNKDAQPRAMTPLYDAAGKLLDRMYADNPKAGVFVVVTDGEENNSKEYNHAQITSKIKTAEKDKNWQVLFIGADFADVKNVSAGLGLASTKSLNVTKGNYGSAMRGLAAMTTTYAVDTMAGGAATMDFDSNMVDIASGKTANTVLKVGLKNKS